MKMKYGLPKICWIQMGNKKKNLTGNTGLLQETTNISNNLTLILKGIRKKLKNKAQSQ